MEKMNPVNMKKSRTTDTAYEVWVGNGFEYRVLKKYTKNEDDPYARAFLATKSPFTFGSWELGDGYIRDYESHASLVLVNPDDQKISDDLTLIG